MGIFLWILLGLAAGAVARQVMPGPDPLGLVGTILVGIAGAVLGGVIGTLTGGTYPGFDYRSLLMATIGSLALLICLRAYAMRGFA